MKRLYLSIYVSLVLAMVVSLVATGIAAPLVMGHHPWKGYERQLTAMGTMLGQHLSPGDSSSPTLSEEMAEVGQTIGFDLTLWNSQGEKLAETGPKLPVPDFANGRSGVLEMTGFRTAVSVKLEDGRWLVLSAQRKKPPYFPARLLAVWTILAVFLVIAAYPVGRRITKRLERLQQGVKHLGSGDLSARVEVEGKDEVAGLAATFNQAANRIEQLITAQRGMLASASHELRSPLARLRMALELLSESEIDQQRRQQITGDAVADITELDELVGDILLASRLHSGDTRAQIDRIQLLSMLQEEADRVEASATGSATTFSGDARLLRRLMRNLLENARRHGGQGAIEASLKETQDGILLTVADRGPGVPVAERERIFEPFYRPQNHSEGQDGGVGLGLALVKQIAEHHGGTAICRARQSGGTEFAVTLKPLTDDATKLLA